MSVSISEVRRVAAIVGELSRQTGIIGETDYPVFSEGSKYYGNSYKMNYTPQGESGHWDIPKIPAYLGFTKQEAYDSLSMSRMIVMAFADGAGKNIDWEKVQGIADKAVSKKRVDWSLWTEVAPWKAVER